MEFDFRHPDYVAIYRRRAQVLAELRSDPAKLAAFKVYYRTHIADFINDWGMTFDPRNVDIGLPAVIPFVLFPRQREYIDWVVARWRGREDGLCDKSRDMGLSWLNVSIAVALWLFEPGFVAGFGSRKEEYVDKLDSPKSLFWKARKFIELLPAEFRPHRWDAPFMKIINHDNGSFIVGEAGDSIGRGDRTSIYFVDEAAFIDRQENVDAALSQTSNCKMYVSTANGNGNPFYQKRHGGKIKVFTFHWRDDPRKDDAWYQKQKDTLDPAILAQEVDIDYNATTTDSWLDGARIEEAQSVPLDALVPVGPLILGVDAAHFGDDESVLSPRRGRVAYDQIRYNKLDGHDLAGRVIDWCDRSPHPVALIVIELDGPGTSCYDTLKRSRYADFVKGVHTGARVAGDKDWNLRAKMYRGLRDWLNQECRLPNDKELKSQAAALRYTYKDGLLLMASKKDMKSKGFKSPDRVDALALTFAAEPDDNLPGMRPATFGHEPTRQKYYNRPSLSHNVRSSRR